MKKKLLLSLLAGCLLATSAHAYTSNGYKVFPTRELGQKIIFLTGKKIVIK